MKLIFVTVTTIISIIAKGQTIDYNMLEKYSHREAQEIVINRQVTMLKLNAGQTAFVKPWSFYYTDKAIAVLKAHKGSPYSLYKKLKPLQTEFNSKMKSVLTKEQFDAWEKDRKKNGIIRQIVK